MKLIDQKLFTELAQKAIESERKRSHYNLHPSLEDSIQRLCVAIEPGSYIRPHRHSEPGKWELFFALHGSAAVLLFDSDGKVAERTIISSKGPVKAIEIPHNKWHTLAALEPGTILFEIKPGPYSPLSENDFAPWAPEEGNIEAIRLEASFHSNLKKDIS